MHLNSTTQMLSYFHTAGHLRMQNQLIFMLRKWLRFLKKLSAREFELFTSKGFFTVKRTQRYWSGTWTDMCIEQCLMRPMKSVGELTHGRGIPESTLSKWVLGTPFF